MVPKYNDKFPFRDMQNRDTEKELLYEKEERDSSYTTQIKEYLEPPEAGRN